MFLETLTDEQRRGIVFLRQYETLRREFTGGGYTAPIPRSADGLANPVFKQGCRAAKYLDDFGFTVGFTLQHWPGYMRNVFAQLSPSIPQPGQFCNPVLLRSYVAGRTFEQRFAKPERTPDQLHELYMKILTPDLRNNTTLEMLGINAIR